MSTASRCTVRADDLSCSSRRKPLMLALRYIAHHYGASLICTSEKDKTQLAYVREVPPAFATLHLRRAGATPGHADRDVGACGLQFRAMLNHYVFHTEAKKTAHLDPSKPLIVPCGSDSFDGIGTPPGARRAQMEDGNIASRMQMWAKAVDTYFPPGEDNGACRAHATVPPVAPLLVHSPSGLALLALTDA